MAGANSLGRLRSLDGLRGLAAFAVVMTHTFYIIPAVADTLYSSPSSMGAPEWWLYRTPLRIIWAGEEAVLIFFVLSGYVLTLFAKKLSQRSNWLGSYYAQRLTRLYLPVWGATALAVFLYVLVPRNNVAGMSPWLARHGDVSLRSILLDTTLVPHPSRLITALWTLQWEVLFSLALPLAWKLVRVLPVRGHWGVWTLFLVSCSVFGRLKPASEFIASPGLAVLIDRAITYIPIFAIGMVIAYDRDNLTSFFQRFAERVWFWPAVGLLSALALVSTSYIATGTGQYYWNVATQFAELLGIVGLLLAAMEWRAFVNLLERRPLQWMGRRSYSLYLVHEPIIVAAAMAVHANGWGWLAIAPVVVVLTVVVSAIFYRFVEKPSIRISHDLGRKLAGAPLVRENTASAD